MGLCLCRGRDTPTYETIHEASFDVRDDFGVVGCCFGSDDHMQMIGQDDDGIYAIIIPGFTSSKSISEYFNVVDEYGLPTVRDQSQIITVSIEINASVIHTAIIPQIEPHR